MSISPWEERYREQNVETMPWYYPDLDPDLAQALDDLQIRDGAILDLGTGPGTQAIALAQRGFDVTASDISETAIASLPRRADELGLSIEARQDNILESRLDRSFDLVFDRGCFHVLPPDERPIYVRTLNRLLRDQGTYFLKCFSHRETGDGPFRFTPEEIEATFSSHFAVTSIRDTVYQGTRVPQPQALFCVMRKHATSSAADRRPGRA